MDLNLSAITGGMERLIATAQNGLEVIRLGGLDTGVKPSPFQVVESTPMYTLRRYFQEREKPSGPALLMVHPMMMSAEMWDVTREAGAVGILGAAGIDPWVIDYGSPDQIEGGMERTLTDHIVALSEAIDIVHAATSQDVHLAGYSQGGMFCYQAAAYRRSKDVASIVVFGSPVDTLAGTPDGPATTFVTAATDFLADRVFSWLDVPGWAARVGFQFLDPVKSVKGRIDFVRQLHDRDALLPREPQRLFLHRDGFIAWSGPAVSELLTEFVGRNKLMSGGFNIDGQMVTLADIRCPVMAFIGEIDDLGKPPAVRGIKRAAPNAEVYEVRLRAGHFGLVVGSNAAAITWPTVAEWVMWRAERGPRPANVAPMCDEDSEPSVSHVPLGSRLALGVVEASGAAVSLARGTVSAAAFANNTVRTLALETLRTLPRLTRLSQINDHTRISLGRFIAEQFDRDPAGEFLLVDGRAQTYEEVSAHIDHLVRRLLSVGIRQGARVGVVMETGPDAVVAVAALSRLGAVPVLFPPDADLAAAARSGMVTTVVADAANHEAVVRRLGSAQILVLGGESGGISSAVDDSVVDLDLIDPEGVDVPDWYRPDPGLARDVGFVLFGSRGGTLFPRQVTNYRWALSALGTASAAALDRSDTVYCLAPLYQPAGLLAGLGGAVAGGARLALSRGLQPESFIDEVRRYGVTVVAYTWAMMDLVIDDPSFTLGSEHSVRLFIGSGMPAGLWRRVLSAFAPAKVVEFFATTDGHAVLANVTGAKIGSKGRALPGVVQEQLGAYDPIRDRCEEDDRGLVRTAEPEEPGLLLARPRGPMDPNTVVLRSVFAPGDTWISTGYVFRRDSDGDLWILGHRSEIIRTNRGVLYPEPVVDALGADPAVDLAAVYGLDSAVGTLAIAAVTVRKGKSLNISGLPALITTAPLGLPPDIVTVVPAISLGPSYRPDMAALKAAGIPEASSHAWFYDPDKGSYTRLTAAVRRRLNGS